MRKKILLKFISFILLIAAIVTVLFAVVAMKLQGAGGISRANCVGIAVICGILAIVAWKFSNSNSEK